VPSWWVAALIVAVVLTVLGAIWRGDTTIPARYYPDALAEVGG
jgi:hypothetical protein